MVMVVCSLTRGPILMLLQLTKCYKEEHIHEFYAFLVEWPLNFKVENLLQFHAIL